jgi:Taurine catabolism dioxygenase TauD, TfdA family
MLIRMVVGKLPLSSLNRASFPLGSLSNELRHLSKSLSDSKGAFLVTGLNPGRLSNVQNVICHAGLASHIGDKRAMAGGEGGDKNVLHHITPLPTPVDEINSHPKIYNGPPNQSIAIPFHNDAGEIVSLYTLSPGSSGGRFYLAPASSIYSELQRTRPDLIPVLAAPWTMISPQPDGSSSSETRPLLFHIPSTNRTIISCSRARITGTPSRPRPSNLPAITPLQHEALDALHFIAQKVAIPIDFQAGDMLFFNNLTMMHARDSFDDDKSGIPDEKRHLLRLIIRDESEGTGKWNVPSELDRQMSALYDHEAREEEFQIEKARFSWETSH